MKYKGTNKKGRSFKDWREKNIRFWFQGKLIPKMEHDRLSWREIFESNNLGGK